jgi:hypothetical protein
MLKSKLAMTYFIFVLLRCRRSDRGQFQGKEGHFVDFEASFFILKKELGIGCVNIRKFVNSTHPKQLFFMRDQGQRQ